MIAERNAERNATETVASAAASSSRARLGPKPSQELYVARNSPESWKSEVKLPSMPSLEHLRFLNVVANLIFFSREVRHTRIGDLKLLHVLLSMSALQYYYGVWAQPSLMLRLSDLAILNSCACCQTSGQTPWAYIVTLIHENTTSK